MLEHIWADQRALLVGRWARRSARSPSPWVRYPGRRRQWAVVGMGRSGNAQLARGYHSCPRRVQSDRSFRVSDRTRTWLRLLAAGPTHLGAYLPTDPGEIMCVCPLRRAVPPTTVPAKRGFRLPNGMRAHPARICTRNGLTPAASASAPGMGSPGMGSPRRICTGTALQLRC